MKIRLGLDLGPNSIGWAVLCDEDGKLYILKAGSRIIPMDATTLSNFETGKTAASGGGNQVVTPTGNRTQLRAARRLISRHILRRERLHRCLNILGFLPEHYANEIYFRSDNHPQKKYGQFKEETEPKLPWFKNAHNEFEFLFKDSFNEMLFLFKESNPDYFSRINNKQLKLIPLDWTLYYLRKKALTEKISREELAWILLNFNQKRGCYLLRGNEENEEKEGKISEYYTLKVKSVESTGQKKKNKTLYNIVFENGWTYQYESYIPLDWAGKSKEYIVTTEINEDGTTKIAKDGREKRTFRAVQEKDWGLLKDKKEQEIEKSKKTVGAYIFDAILKNPDQKINGSLINAIDRDFYKKELKQILESQYRFYQEFQNSELLDAIIEELYPKNKEHKILLKKKDLIYLLMEDVIFYQRPLKIKKSLISNCQYEQQKYYDKENNKEIVKPVKVIAKSNPWFQEFRLWQFVSNIKIYRKDTFGEADVTAELISNQAEVFDKLNNIVEIKQDGFFTLIGVKKPQRSNYRWNYDEDKAYPCNETRGLLYTRLKKVNLSNTEIEKIISTALDKDPDVNYLWHMLHSIKYSKELKKALRKFALKNNFDEEKIVTTLSKCKPFSNGYGSYSEKAIKKLLPLMRTGKYWNEKDIDAATKERIYKIIDGEEDGHIDADIRKHFVGLDSIEQFSGLKLHQACYLVYGRHSEAVEAIKWGSPKDINKFLQTFRQHSLRNPIVEQVVTETLRTVRDIWKSVGQIDEIHLELSRDMKNPAEKRKTESERNNKNEDDNIRIKKLLQEFEKPEYNIPNVRIHSPKHNDLLRIYEDTVLKSVDVLPEEIALTIKNFKETEAKQPKPSEILKYKLWLEQKYQSPYTGAIIPLGKLFTGAYQIEHVIPRATFTDNSESNKVICEMEVNKQKGKMLPLEFLENETKRKIHTTYNGVVTLFGVEEYKNFVAKTYAKNTRKLKNLLRTEVPTGFSERQGNDTKYIAKYIMGILSNIVREEGEKEATSKNLIVCSGGTTSTLRKEWGMNDVWNQIISPRFERLNQLVKTENSLESNYFGQVVDNKFRPTVPIELSKGFNKKRIDHRHHAMDAIVIACTTRSHVNFLNNMNSSEGISRDDLKRKLCYKSRPDEDGNYHWIFYKPWKIFTEDSHGVLKDMVVGIKQNLKVISDTSNYTFHYNAEGKKVLQKQTKGDNLAIRKSLHKDTVFGKVNLRFQKEVGVNDALENWKMIVEKEVKEEVCSHLSNGKTIEEIKKILKAKEIKKLNIYYFSDDKTSTILGAARKSIDTSFDVKKITTSITDTGIQKIMLAHLEQCNNDPEIAFSPEGLAMMNENIVQLNNGKFHKPIFKARIYETIGSKFTVGSTGNKSSKFVEADKGTNLFFAVYKKPDGRRVYDTIPLNIVIEQLKQGLAPAKDKLDDESKLLFTLSPNEFVYVPNSDQIGCPLTLADIDITRIYKMVSCTGSRSFYIPQSISNKIIETVELGSNNKSERTWTGEMIKEICIPIKVNRLGEIIEIKNHD